MISIVIPLYNKEKSIAQTLESVLRQNDTDYEVVIVDDASTDCSYAIAKDYASRDSRIRLFKQENGGPSKARNTGVRNAKGDWILFLDADDELLPMALKNFSEMICSHPEINFFAAAYYYHIKKQNILASDFQTGIIKSPIKAFVLGLFITRTGSFVCTKQLCQEYPFNEQIKRFEDFDFLLRIHRKEHVYVFNATVLINHTNFSAASCARKDIAEDFVGHLDFHGKGFWERIALYGLFLGEREYYPKQCHNLYPSLYHRYDLLITYKILGWIKKQHFAMKIVNYFIYRKK